VVVLWGVTIVMGLAGSLAGGIFTLLTAQVELSEDELRNAMMLPTAAGMLVGALCVVMRAGRPQKSETSRRTDCQSVHDFCEDA